MEVVERGRLREAEHQVGGHRSGARGRCLTDGAVLYKPLPEDVRGRHEVGFYAAMQAECGGGAWPEWVPRVAGGGDGGGGEVRVRALDESEGAYLALEDVTGPYREPCVADVKLGHRTWYAGMRKVGVEEEEYVERRRRKDAETGTRDAGARLSGMQVFNRAAQTMWRPSRAALEGAGGFERFVENLHRFCALNGRTPREVLPDVVAQLAAARAWLAGSRFGRDWQMCSCSALIVYEGARGATAAGGAAGTPAGTPAGGGAAVRVVLVDFAHSFPLDGADPGEGGNQCLAGLDALGALLRDLLDVPPPALAKDTRLAPGSANARALALLAKKQAHGLLPPLDKSGKDRGYAAA